MAIRQTMKKLYVPIIIFSLLMQQAPLTAHASEPVPEIYLSEINWAGSSLSTADEWLEITNRTSTAVDLSGWVLDGAGTGGGAVALAAGTMLTAQSNLLITNYDLGDPKTTLQIKPALVTSAISLPNSNLTIRLIMPDGTVVDSASFGSSPKAGTTKPPSSAVRQQDGNWISASSNNNLSDLNQFGTPGTNDLTWFTEVPIAQITPEPATVETPAISTPPEIIPEVIPEIIQEAVPEIIPEIIPETIAVENPVIEQPAPTVNAGDIKITEFLSSPVSGPEWVEVQNQTTSNIPLDNVFLQDASASITNLSGTLNADDFLVINNPKGKLNNDGDTITLAQNDGPTIDSITYNKENELVPDKGLSSSLIDDSWEANTEPSPAAENIPPKPIIEPVVNDPIPAAENIDPAPIATTAPAKPEEPATPEVVKIVALAQNTESVTTEQSQSPEVKAEKTPKVKKTKTTKKSSTTIIDGTITAAPGVFGKQIAYIDGYQIYLNDSKWPNLQAGDNIRLYGTLTEAKGEKRLKLKSNSDITLISNGDLEAESITAENIDSPTVGHLVSFSGTITTRTKSVFTLEIEGGKTLTVHLAKNQSPNSLTSDQVNGAGIWRLNNGQAEIYLRTANDLQLITPTAPANETTTNKHHLPSKPLAGAGIFTSTLGLIGYWFKKSIIKI